MSTTISQVVDRVSGRLVGPGIWRRPVEDIVATELIDATHDSRSVERGWLFCCVPGETVDGHDFAAGAVELGAVALLVDRELGLDVPQILVDDVRAVMGPAAAAIHGDPSHRLTVVGVTGTNGKSSIVQLLADIWAQVGTPSEIIGTLVGTRTTPEGTELQRRFRQAVDGGVQAMAIEVSSHALALHRVAGTRFSAAVFSNLGRDHLDFHGTVEQYFQAKAALFDPELSASGVINRDDAHGRRLLEAASIPMTDYGLSDAVDLRFDGAVSRFDWKDQPIVLQLAGSHNVLNALAAATCAELLGMEPVDIADALCATSPVRGRFEAVDAGQPFHVAVDYAHTPDALAAALVAARQVVGSGRVLVVFGCGGDREVQKRAEMGRVAEQGADVVVVTSDNPRSEEPRSIIDDILVGVRSVDEVVVEPDRARAIAAAVGSARPGDMVLIAGKGHETYQIIGDDMIDFDDRQVVLRALGVPA
ncbi:MAG: UDP-N-acetylmuramoyl-L-alanyl-D-glutamate--2,6-diaminopimelate ligase [Acidimicrobiales bacterium]